MSHEMNGNSEQTSFMYIGIVNEKQHHESEDKVLFTLQM